MEKKADLAMAWLDFLDVLELMGSCLSCSDRG